jgi:hypothetical protein
MVKYIPLFFLFLNACSNMPINHPPLQIVKNSCDSSQAQTPSHMESLLCQENTEFQLASYNTQRQLKLQSKDRLQKNLFMGAGLAALNNPKNPSGDVDNLSVTVGGKLSFKGVSFRPEIQMGERSNSFNNSVTRDFSLLGNGLGAIEGNIGLGYSVNTGDENNVLGNADSAFLRIGAEGYLAGDIMTGVAVMVAPWGYNGEDAAIAGVGYLGFRF